MKLSINELNQIVKRVFNILNYQDDKKFSPIDTDTIYVKSTTNDCLVGGGEKSDFARAIMLYVKEAKSGKSEFEIIEKRHFKRLGVCFDVSRGGVIKVPAIKRYMDELSLMGFNEMYLYMEDVFELDNYPHFGYLRGRYTKEQLKEISSYGEYVGIDVIPSIQMLGHMGQYLQWNEAEDIKDTKDILLCDSEKTFVFLEEIVKTMRECFSTKYLQIGCDEAVGLGTGKFLEKNGYKKSLDILHNHINKCCELCRKYDFTPIGYVDTYFRNLNPRKDYYEKNITLPCDLSKGLPEFETVYWDYYHIAEEDYDTFIDYHKEFKEIPNFLGGVWTWCGHLVNVRHTLDTMIPAMKSCLKKGVENVSAALFGDDGTWCVYDMAFPLFNIFSEYCFKGDKSSYNSINEMCKFLYDVDLDDYQKVSKFYYPFIEGLPFELLANPNCLGEKILCTDLFFNTAGTSDFKTVLPHHIEGYNETLNLGKGSKWENYYYYANIIFDISKNKIIILSDIQRAYKENDKIFLSKTAKEKIPYIIEKFNELYKIHKKQWKGTFKAFGWEEIESRYAIMIDRLNYVKETIEEYLNGQINEIEELDYELINDPYGNRFYSGFSRFREARTVSATV